MSTNHGPKNMHEIINDIFGFSDEENDMDWTSSGHGADEVANNEIEDIFKEGEEIAIGENSSDDATRAEFDAYDGIKFKNNVEGEEPINNNGDGPSGVWTVTRVFNNHNHALDPKMTRMMPSPRNLTLEMKRTLEANDIAGIRPSKSIRMLEVQKGGPNNLGCLPKDCRNFIESNRRLRLGEGDAHAIQNLFMKLQQEERDFFYLINTDVEGRLANVLWVHPRCKAAYEEFHDVVCFDTTYLVNRYNMSFGTIIGVNKHGQSILLGCALISHENISSFKWLFSTWLDAMGGIHPNGILSDQCPSITAVVKEVMPNTRHRFCLWHIMQKVPMKFSHIAEFDSAVSDFKKLVYESHTILEFERKWNEFIEKCSLENNQWLSSLYKERESWASVYLDHFFWAGMVSSQRSESMHVFFDDYIHHGSTLKQFVEQYAIALRTKIQKESKADFDSNNKVVKCVSQFLWEKQFVDVYTHSILKKVQTEIRRVMHCHLIAPTDEERLAMAQDIQNGIEKYKILDKCIIEKKKYKDIEFTVEYIQHGGYLSCSCRKFEAQGLLCRHVFLVMSFCNITHLNERYICRRWRKDIFRPHTRILFHGGYPHMTEAYKSCKELENVFQECVDLCTDSVPRMDYLKQRLELLKNDVINWLTRGRGRPRTNRIKGKIELEYGSRDGRKGVGGRGCSARVERNTNKSKNDNEGAQAVFANSRKKKDSSREGRGFSARVDLNTNQSTNDNEIEHQYTQHMVDKGLVVPYGLYSYIVRTKDVESDGHCGFRAIAGLLGYNEESWGRVRGELYNELLKNQELYSKVFKENGGVENTFTKLNYYKDVAPKKYWFSLPDMGHLVASCYNVALVCLDERMSQTYLPLRTTISYPPRMLCIGIVNKNHFIQVFLKEDCPLPAVYMGFFPPRNFSRLGEIRRDITTSPTHYPLDAWFISRSMCMINPESSKLLNLF
ncbi:protein far-red impaired response 1 [Phtheirospermum japonicum]|uniref:Protein FAR1-RELATED SEQUENCE n=1 Tax=Phtheirospermum japonicum TaxID=374723 RepID=A0A830CPF0_9LAMI|nr:protein far-red impaired response 1 [Phtheirospermum japonicum]